ncbi:MAG TPA: hypothetical protein VNA20_07250 [Frankiaceae bacterium]|nr:hypothetical protein [Frankiaceae bacterium]
MRRLPLAALATAAATLAAPAGAAPPNEFVLRGNRTAWVDVKVGGGGLNLGSVMIETRGRFAGVYGEQIESINPQSVGKTQGWLYLRSFTTSGGDPEPVRVGRDAFDPGVVRLYLIADGPTTVWVDTHTPTRLNPEPKHPVTAAAGAVTLARSGDALAGRTALPVAQRSFTFAGLLAEGTLPALAEAEVCVNRAAACPQPPVPAPMRSGLFQTGSGWNDVSEVTGPRWAWTSGYDPQFAMAERGRNTARFSLTHAAEIRRAVGVAFTLTLA